MAPARAHRMRETVLTAQVAFALTLLIGAALLTRSLMALGSVDVGFEPEELLTFSFDLPNGSYSDPESRRIFYRDAVTAVADIPGIEAAASVTPMPMEMGSVPSSWILSPDVRPNDPTVMAHMRTVTPNYFDAMGIRVVRGREFNGRDEEDSEAVVLVNETFVERHLDGREPLGARVSAGQADSGEPDWATIVGVVADIRFQSLTGEGEPEIYMPAQQLPSGWGHLVVRAADPGGQVVNAVYAAVQEFDSNLALAEVRSGEDIVGRHLTTSRLSTTLSLAFAAAATVLAVVGILGVLSIALAQRVTEMGLRMVLGASVGSIRSFALVRSLRPVAIGLTLGLVLSVAGSRLLQNSVVGARFLESQVFGITAGDPLSYALATLGFAAASFVACLVPSVRASRADPLSLLRSE